MRGHVQNLPRVDSTGQCRFFCQIQRTPPPPPKFFSGSATDIYIADPAYEALITSMVVLSAPDVVEHAAIRSLLETVLHVLVDKVGLIVYCGLVRLAVGEG